MEISVKRSGGFAGLTEEVVRVDTAELPAVVAEQVKRRVEEIRFFDLPAFVSGSRVGADLEKYEVAIIEGDRQHTVAFIANDHENADFEPLRRLVDTLVRIRK